MSLETQNKMTEEAQGRKRGRSKLWIAALALTILVSILVIPPLVSINRYKSRITHAMSASLGRPVHMSGVELRILPRPGFVITDLTVDEDPAYGVEPVLHANEVKAAIRLFSLWRGRLEISRVSVDEASLNLVHAADGRWNLDPLFRTAAQSQPGDALAAGRKIPLPYLEATNSRINIVRGYEKLPYSLVNADLSFWEENPGDWRVRLKGQPARTDVSLDLGDTGIVQLEARMRRAPEMRVMPIHVEAEWRNAQLGQLSRLLIGSDPGWRGDLTAEMKMDGTADSAQVTTRLRAAGVHRAEFAPAVPLDFDANCGFAYHYSARTLEHLACDSPLGDGRLHLEGNLPSNGQPKLSLALQRIPAQAILDALRTVRSEVGAGLTADGSLSGTLSYDATAPAPIPPPVETLLRHAKKTGAKQAPAVPNPLSGSIVLDALKLSGGSLTQPIQIQKAVLEPTIGTGTQDEELAGTANVPAGAPTPIQFKVRLTLNGYQVAARGAGTPTRLRQLAHAAGLKEAGALDSIAGDPITLDLSIEGPWLPAPDETLVQTSGIATPSAAPLIAQPLPDRLSGTVTLHNANWKSDALPTAVEIPQATLHMLGGAMTSDSVSFVYGPLAGTAHVQIPAICPDPRHCVPTVNLDFETLDAAELQTTLLGSQKKGTLLSTVLTRLSSSAKHTWPAFQGTLKADSLVLGPVTLQSFAADVNVAADSAELTSVDAVLLGGQVHLTGKIESPDKPSYSLDGRFENVDSAALCSILSLKCTGSSFEGDGKLELAGYEGKDLAASAKGTLHFVWKKGSVVHPSSPDATPAALARFDTWTADVAIADGAVTLAGNQVQQGKHTASVMGQVTFADPPLVSFGPAKTPPPLKK